MSSLEKTVDAIKKLKIQGARSIALAGLYVLKNIIKKSGFGKDFKRAATLLYYSRPTGVALWNALEKIRKNKDMKIVDDLIFYFENVCGVIAPFGLKIIKNNFTILTHCHSTAVVEMLTYAWKNGRRFKVIATETRPLYQGIKTAKELTECGIPVTLIIDSAVGHFIKEIDIAIFGCDAIRKEGVVNKIGTYPLALFAKENGIPVYFVGETMKFDRRKKIIIEERSWKEITKKKLGCEIKNPAFDITPWKYVDGVITEKGIITPNKILRLIK